MITRDASTFTPLRSSRTSFLRFDPREMGSNISIAPSIRYDINHVVRDTQPSASISTAFTISSSNEMPSSASSALMSALCSTDLPNTTDDNHNDSTKEETTSTIITDRAVTLRQQIINISSPRVDEGFVANPTGRKVALIVCNSYHRTRYDLGDCAISDGLLAHERFARYGYETVVLYDVVSNIFLASLKRIISASFDTVALYFIGHGTYVRDMNGDEADGYDECLLFRDRTVLDDDIARIIKESKQCRKLILMADCCHSGTIYDIEPRDDIITLSACRDNQTAKQVMVTRKGNGVFSYYFWNLIDSYNNELGPLMKAVDEKLKKYDQSCVCNKVPTGKFL